MLTLLLLAVIGQPALAQDPGSFDFDTRQIPDLLEAFRDRAPIMGVCPLGEVDRRAVPPGRHLLHLGTTGFYLDLDGRIELTERQRVELVRIRDQALKAGAELDAEILAAEHEVWATSSSLANSEALRAKVRTVETLRTNQRLLYVDAVTEAASQLTEKQRRILTKK